MTSDSQVDNLTLETIPASCTEEMGWKQVNNSVGEQLNGGSNIDGLIEALISSTLLLNFFKKFSQVSRDGSRDGAGTGFSTKSKVLDGC